MGQQGDASKEAMVVQRLQVQSRTYEHRFNRCGKVNCTKCMMPLGGGLGRPGHGPYWYLCVMQRGKWLRVYLGKVLNTEKYAKPDGTVDFAEIRRERAERAARKRKG